MIVYHDFLESLRLKHFDPREFLVGLDQGNERPPRELWGNIALAATVLDRLRSALGGPIVITSAYRAEEYNRHNGGSGTSQHLANAAIDFVPPGEVSAAWVQLRKWQGRLFDVAASVERRRLTSPAGEVPFSKLPAWDRREGEGTVMPYLGGIGVYKGFIHLDTRGSSQLWHA